MRFLVVILASFVVSFAGCDTDLGSASDQYFLTFNVTDGEQGVTYKKGSSDFGGLPVFLYSYDDNESVLVVASQEVTLDDDGRIAGAGTIIDYLYLALSDSTAGTTMTSSASESTVIYDGIDYYNGVDSRSVSYGEVTISNDNGDGTFGPIVTGEFSANIYDGTDLSTITISGTFKVLAICTDSSSGDTEIK